MKWGEVTQTDPLLVSVGGGGARGGFMVAQSYHPAVGDRVLIDTAGAREVVVDAVAETAAVERAHAVGDIVMHAAANTPPNMLVCDGAAVSRTTYADLFDEIGTVYGAGDGTSTFNVPNLDTQFVKGSTSSVGTSAGALDGSHSHPISYDTVADFHDTAGNSVQHQVSQASTGAAGVNHDPPHVKLYPLIQA